ncbi:MAG: hypothetical protein K0S39_6008 [Paenibacillus sp.]|jgi:hypothetical protein|nr:hypothetical protein [Paenibacillus sp.]
MLQEFIIYGLAVCFIGFMFVLCMDVVRRNSEKFQSASVLIHKEAVTKVKETLEYREKPLVYPLYVDCSPDLIKNHLSLNSSDIQTALVPGRSA